MNEFDDERPMVLGCGRALLRNRVAAADAVAASNPEGHNQYTAHADAAGETSNEASRRADTAPTKEKHTYASGVAKQASDEHKFAQKAAEIMGNKNSAKYHADRAQYYSVKSQEHATQASTYPVLK